jgi:hypothetical protein
MSYKRILKAITQEAREVVLDMRDGEALTIAEVLNADNPAQLMKPIFDKSACTIPSGLYQKVQRLLEIGGATPETTGIYAIASKATITEEDHPNADPNANSSTSESPSRIPRHTKPLSSPAVAITASKTPLAKITRLSHKKTQPSRASKPNPAEATAPPGRTATNSQIEALAQEAEQRVRDKDGDGRRPVSPERSPKRGQRTTGPTDALQSRRRKEKSASGARTQRDSRKPKKSKHRDATASTRNQDRTKQARSRSESSITSSDDDSISPDSSSNSDTDRHAKKKQKRRRQLKAKYRRRDPSTTTSSSDTSSSFDSSDTTSSSTRHRGRGYRRRQSSRRHHRDTSSEDSTDDSSHPRNPRRTNHFTQDSRRKHKDPHSVSFFLRHPHASFPPFFVVLRTHGFSFVFEYYRKFTKPILTKPPAENY